MADKMDASDSNGGRSWQSIGISQRSKKEVESCRYSVGRKALARRKLNWPVSSFKEFPLLGTISRNGFEGKRISNIEQGISNDQAEGFGV